MVDLEDTTVSMPGHIHSAPLGVKPRLSETACLTLHKYPRVSLWVGTLPTATLYLEAGCAGFGEDSNMVSAR